ncbi:MAG: hypothetical protein ACLQPD_00125 [Desulfomonilaceae bacterium]
MEYAARADSAEKRKAGRTRFCKSRIPPRPLRPELYPAGSRDNILVRVLVSLPGARNANLAWFKKQELLAALIIVSTILLYLHEFLFISGSARA